MTPALHFPPELLLLAQGAGLGMKAAIFDVDGVLTDGRLYVDEQGERFKAFHVDGVLTDGRLYVDEQGERFKAFHALDGHGLKLLAGAGIEPVIVTGRDSPAVRRRVADLGLAHARFGVADKLAEVEALRCDLGIDWSELAVMGDDWPDLPVMVRAGFACAPPNAHAEVRAAAHHVTRAGGGEGAVRECCDLLLMASGRYARLLDSHLTTLDGR